MILFTIYGLLTMKVNDGNGKPRKRKRRNQGKILRFGRPPIPPFIKLEADCFPGRNNRKQAGPILDRTGILIYRDKEIQGRARYGSIEAGNMIFIHVNFQDLQQKRAGVWVEVQNNGDGKILRTND